MRHLIVFGLAILLSCCAGTMSNYYTQSVNSWRGESASALIKRWGRPDIQMPGPDGGTFYVYRSVGYNHSNTRTSPEIGVNTTGSRPVVVVKPTTNTWDQNRLMLTCLTSFLTNARGIITEVQSQGSGCYGSQDFASKYMNAR